MYRETAWEDVYMHTIIVYLFVLTYVDKHFIDKFVFIIFTLF